MSEKNDALAQRSWELAIQHDPDVLEGVYAPSSVWHEPDQDVQGVEEAKQYNSTRLSAFPNLSVTVGEVIAEGGQGSQPLDGAQHEEDGSERTCGLRSLRAVCNPGASFCPRDLMGCRTQVAND